MAKAIGQEYLIPLLGVWSDARDIDFEKLPDIFVLKCNHDCASVVIYRDKKTFVFSKARIKLDTCLRRIYYDSSREWAYKDVKPMIMAEEYFHDNLEQSLTDSKFFCFSGNAIMLYVGIGELHTNQQRIDYFDKNYKHLPIKRGSIPNAKSIPVKPKNFDSLFPLIEKIAGDIPFICVDFYLVNGHPYFGEIAFYPSAGLAEFSPHEWEEQIGSWIQLPQIKNESDR